MRIQRRKHDQRAMFRLVAALFVAGLALTAGCGKDESQNAQSGSPPAHSTKRIAFAGIGFQDDQFFKLAEAGMKDAAKKAGADLLLGTSAGTQDKEITLVETYTSQKVSAIVIAPL